jgi:hypothetical protein
VTIQSSFRVRQKGAYPVHPDPQPVIPVPESIVPRSKPPQVCVELENKETNFEFSLGHRAESRFRTVQSSSTVRQKGGGRGLLAEQDRDD